MSTVSFNTDDNCITSWLPKLELAGVPVPKTIIVKATGIRLVELLDGKTPENYDWFLNKVKAAIQEIGEPCFLRTGQTSGKHGWKRTCYVTSKDTVSQNIVSLIEYSECACILGLPYNVWAIRELLPTKPAFYCTAYDDFPVVREFRFFVKNGKVCYYNAYWPERALKQGKPNITNWREEYYGKLIVVTPQEQLEMEALVEKVAQHIPGEWSIDVLDTDKGWYVTDMAVALESFGFDAEKFTKGFLASSK